MSVNRIYNLKVRLTPEEMLRVQRNATRLNVTVSDYVRSLLSIPICEIDDDTQSGVLPDDAVRLVVYDRRSYPKIIRQLRAWGYHYNQAIHALNIIQSKRFLPPEDTYVLMTKANRLLGEINDEKEKIHELIDGLPIAPHAMLPASKPKE